jgi:high-affinity Fe2+/Pb2+ permease
VILGVVQHFTGLLGNSVQHLSIYLAVVGAILLIVGVFMMMRGRSAA